MKTIAISESVCIVIDDQLRVEVRVFESPQKFDEKRWTASGAYSENTASTISALARYIVASAVKETP